MTNDSAYRLTTLPNGARIASIAMPHMRSVSVGFWVGIGGRHEKKEECGHLALHRAPALQGDEAAHRAADFRAGGGARRVHQCLHHRGSHLLLRAGRRGASAAALRRAHGHVSALALCAAGDRARARRHPRGDPLLPRSARAARLRSAHRDDVAAASARAPADRHGGNDRDLPAPADSPLRAASITMRTIPWWRSPGRWSTRRSWRCCAPRSASCRRAAGIRASRAPAGSRASARGSKLSRRRRSRRISPWASTPLAGATSAATRCACSA